VISRLGGSIGDGDSRNPVIGNAGCYVTFESDATNLGLNAGGNTGDINKQPDIYLYTDVRDLTLVQSVRTKAVPAAGGGRRPGMSFYANYIVFDSPAPMKDQGFGALCPDPDLFPPDEGYEDPPVIYPDDEYVPEDDYLGGSPTDPGAPKARPRTVPCEAAPAQEQEHGQPQVFMRYLGPV
jgi:hypothetical protein